MYFRTPSGTINVLNLKNKKIEEVKTAAWCIGDLSSYKNKIYYDEFRTDVSTVTVYEADADGKNEKVLFKNINNFTIIGNILYYVQMDKEYSDIYTNATLMSYNLDTKEKKLLRKITSGSWVYFTNFGYAYGKTSDADPYNMHIVMFNGEEINKQDYIEYANNGCFICQETAHNRYNRYYIIRGDDVSDVFDIPTQGQLFSVFGFTETDCITQ